MEDNRILRLPEVRRLTGLSTSSLYRSIKRGTFPPPVALGANAVGWRSRDVAAWIEDRPVIDPARPREVR